MRLSMSSFLVIFVFFCLNLTLSGLFGFEEDEDEERENDDDRECQISAIGLCLFGVFVDDDVEFVFEFKWLYGDDESVLLFGVRSFVCTVELLFILRLFRLVNDDVEDEDDGCTSKL